MDTLQRENQDKKPHDQNIDPSTATVFPPSQEEAMSASRPSTSWIFLPDSFTLPPFPHSTPSTTSSPSSYPSSYLTTSSNLSNTSPHDSTTSSSSFTPPSPPSRPLIITIGSVILGGYIDIFPTYESSSLIQISSSFPPTSSPPPTPSSSSSSSYAIHFIQNKLIHHSKFPHEVIISNWLRGLEWLGQGVIQTDSSGTHYEGNHLLCSSASAAMKVNLDSLLSLAFQSLLTDLFPKQIRERAEDTAKSHPIILCVPSSMSIQAKCRIMESILNSSTNECPSRHIRTVLSSTSAIIISFLRSLFNSQPSSLISSTERILNQLEKFSSCRQSGGDPFRDETEPHQLKSEQVDDQELNLKLLVVEVGEDLLVEYLSASIVEVENAHIFRHFENPKFDPQSLTSPYGSCTIRILGSSTSMYGWKDADEHFTQAIAEREWNYLFRFYIANSTLPPTLISSLESLNTVLTFIGTTKRMNEPSMTKVSRVVSSTESLESCRQDSIWSELTGIISSCFYSFLKSEGDTVEESIDYTLCLVNIQKAVRVYLRSYLRDYLEDFRSKHKGEHLMKAASLMDVIEKINEFADESYVCVRDDPTTKSQKQGDKRREEYEKLDKLYLGYYERKMRGPRCSQSRRTFQEVIGACVKQAIQSSRIDYTEEFYSLFPSDSDSSKPRKSIHPKLRNRIGKDGWRHAHRLSSHSENSKESRCSPNPSAILPFDSVVLHVECRQVKVGEKSLNDLPEQNVGRGSIKVPGVREALESVVKSYLRKGRNQENSNSYQKQHSAADSPPVKTPLTRSLRSASEPKLPAVTVATYAAAFSRTHKRTSNRPSKRLSSPYVNIQRDHPYFFEVSVGCIWEGTCFAATQLGHALHIFECPPTIGLRLVEQEIASTKQKSINPLGGTREILSLLQAPSSSSSFPLTSKHSSQPSVPERNRTESWDTALTAKSKKVENSDFFPSLNESLTQQCGITSSRILWLLGDTPSNVLDIRNLNDELERDSDDDQFYLSHIDRYPIESGDLDERSSHRGSDVQEDIPEDDVDMDSESDTRSISSSLSYFSLISDSFHEENSDSEHFENMDDGFDSDAHRGVQFIRPNDAGGGFGGHCQVALRYYPIPSSRSLLCTDKPWCDLWAAFPLDSKPLTNNPHLTNIPHSTLDLQRFIHHNRQESRISSLSVTIPANTLSAVITRQDIESLPTSLSTLNSPSSIHRTMDGNLSPSSPKLISSPLRQSKSLSSLSSLLNHEALSKSLPVPPSVNPFTLTHRLSFQENDASRKDSGNGYHRCKWVIQVVQRLNRPFSSPVLPSGCPCNDDHLSVVSTIPLPSRLLRQPSLSSSSDFAFTISINHSHTFVACELHPIELIIQEPPTSASTDLNPSPHSDSSPAAVPPPVNSLRKRRNSLQDSVLQQKKKDEKLRKKKIQKVRSMLNYGCGGLLTFLFCCFVIFFATSHVRRLQEQKLIGGSPVQEMNAEDDKEQVIAESSPWFSSTFSDCPREGEGE